MSAVNAYWKAGLVPPESAYRADKRMAELREEALMKKAKKCTICGKPVSSQAKVLTCQACRAQQHKEYRAVHPKRKRRSF